MDTTGEKKYVLNDNMYEICNYVNGYRHGPYKMYQNDKLLKECVYENGEMHGLYTSYYMSTGAICLRLNCYHGMFHGMWIEHDQYGNVKGRTIYRYGNRHGPSVANGSHIYYWDDNLVPKEVFLQFVENQNDTYKYMEKYLIRDIVTLIADYL
jgi:antitoxin component YwqK of YwqJK toxin-antitoxin module